MSAVFSRTMRSLEADARGRFSPATAVVVLLLGGWGAWAALGRVAVREVSEAARIEAAEAVHPVAAEVAGRVVRTELAIGREVAPGEVLVELDSEAEQLALAEGRARLADLSGRLEALRVEIAAGEAALAARSEAGEVAVEEAAAQLAEAEARANVAAKEAERVSSERAGGVVSEIDRAKIAAEAEASRARARAVAIGGRRLERDRVAEAADRRQKLAGLAREAAELRGEAAIAQASLPRLEREVERRRIRAPIAGRVGAVEELKVGAVVAAGQRLASIVPAGELRAVAFFPPAAIGRIRPGQPARLRLDGYPWLRYGAIPATVVRAANEPTTGADGGGRVRVELALKPDPDSQIPVAHGLPGAADVEVERISPAALLLRAAGALVAGR